MARSSQPRKAYRRRPAADLRGRARPWAIEAAFGPLEDMLVHLQREGSFDVSESGELIYVLKRFNTSVEVIAALQANVEIFEVMRARDQACPDAAALRHLMNALTQGEVSSSEVDAAIRCLKVLLAYMSSQPLSAMADVARTVEIKARMEALDE